MTEKERFRLAVHVVLEHEGEEYTEDPDDPGGGTKYGISSRSYPHLDIQNLTRQAAEQIYYQDFWLRYRYSELEDPIIATKVLDLSVNVGPSPAHRMLQRGLHACGWRDVVVDGFIGPQTLGAANGVDSSNLLVALRVEAAAHYRRLVEERSELDKYLRGWLNRAYS